MDFSKIKLELQEQGINKILVDEPIFKYTTYRTGGKAALFVMVETIEQLQISLKYIRDKQVPYFILGNGSNILFGDKPYQGIVLCLKRHINGFKIEGTTVEVLAGASMIKVALELAKIGLSGCEFMAGIPGSFGGGIYMNAGAYKSDFSDIIISVTFIDELGEIRTLNNEELQFGYRKSIFQNQPNWTIISAKIQQTVGDSKEIEALIQQRKERRCQTQPYDKPSAGSVFRNPNEKGSWYYIDQIGMRGHCINGAQVSSKHSNFIINAGGATSQDIYELMMLIQKRVYEQYRIELHPEVRLVNM